MTHHMPVKSLVPGQEGCVHRGPVCGRLDSGPHEDVEALRAENASLRERVTRMSAYIKAAEADVETYRAALDTARREAIEDCAKVAEENAAECNAFDCCHDGTPSDIRALGGRV